MENVINYIITNNSLTQEVLNKEDVSLNSLKNHAYFLMKTDVKLAHKIFEAIYYIRPNQYDICRRLVIHAAHEKRFSDALNFANDLSCSLEYSCDAKLYILLLEKITNFNSLQPNVSLSELLLTNQVQKYNNIELNNEIREHIFNGNYKYALGLFSNLFELKATSNEIFIIYLLKEVIKKEDEYLVNLLENEKYEEFYNYLNQKTNINKMEQNYEELSYLILQESAIPQKQTGASNLYEAISKYDYEYALKNAKNNKILKKLLEHIIILRNKQEQEMLFYDTLDNVYISFQENDALKISSLLEKYLKKIGRNDFILLYNVLTKIACYFNDFDLLSYYLEMPTFKYFTLDIDYIQKVLIKLLDLNNLPLALELIRSLKMVSPEYIDSIKVDYLESLYNEKNYKLNKIEYPCLDDDININCRIEEINDYFNSFTNDIRVIEYNDELSALKVRILLEKNKNICFLEEKKDDKFIFYIKKYKPVESLENITKIQEMIDYWCLCGREDRAIPWVFLKLMLEPTFNYETIEEIANIYALNGKMNFYHKYQKLAENIYNLTEKYNDNTFIEEVKRLVQN